MFMKNYLAATLLLFVVITSCKKNDDVLNTTPADPYYYPPITGDAWETKTITSVGWDEAKLQAAFDFAATKQTYGLVVLHHGKIVKEQYWNGWNKDTKYYIASAGKSVVAFVAGIAQQEGLLNINNKVSQYLGNGWTSEPAAKENLITVKHQLSMTTGLNDAMPDQDCTTPACLTYKSDAGTRWAYHNAPYKLLQTVIGNAVGQTFGQYCRAKLFNKTGMSGAFWLDYTMYCTTREAARFGSLILTKGSWNGTSLINDDAYFNAMVNTSQNYNVSYGYLWWLNGKQSSMAPQSQLVFNAPLVPNAPADMFCALGKDDKKIYVVPSLDVVVVRLGDDAGASALGPSSFDNELWGMLKPAIKY